MTRKKRIKSKEEELWQEMKERGEDKKLTSADLVEIIRKSSRQCFQKKVFEKLAELVLVKEGVAQSRLFLLIKYALEKEIPWLVKGSWGLLKKSYPTKETLIFIVKYVDDEKIKKEAWGLIPKKELTNEELEDLEPVVIVNSTVARIKDSRRNIIEELKKVL